jgi:hypothetical protein
MNLIVKVILAYVVIILAVFILGHFYDGSTRYPCQEPQNWHSAECTAPKCLTDDTCTKDLFPENKWKEMGLDD